MRELVIGDIHGGLRGLEQVLERSAINSSDRLIFLGDYVDGWSESAQVIDYLIDLSTTNSCVFIKGNHDIWCESWLKDQSPDEVWLEHGGKGTIKSYEHFSKEQKQKHLDFFESMVLYHLDKHKRLFLHAGFTSMHGVKRERHTSAFYYDRTLWETALAMDNKLHQDSVLYPKRLTHYSEIYIGHTPTLYFDKYEPMNAVNVWNVDTGAAFTGPLSVLDINTKELFQSDILRQLYPHEMGRNSS